MQRINQSDLDRIRWYHEFDFPGDLKARSTEPDVVDHRAVWRHIEGQLDTIDLAGKAVMDVGCWDGYFSFLAEKKGAASVLAVDDTTQNWGTGQGIAVARELLGSSIQTKLDQSIYTLGKLDRRFDVIFCFGVYYHLLEPLSAFRALRACCHADTLVLLEGDVWTNSNRMLAEYGFTDPRHPAFLPTLPLLLAIVEKAGFAVVRIHWQRGGREFKGWLKQRLGRNHQERVFLVCRVLKP